MSTRSFNMSILHFINISNKTVWLVFVIICTGSIQSVQTLRLKTVARNTSWAILLELYCEWFIRVLRAPSRSFFVLHLVILGIHIKFMVCAFGMCETSMNFFVSVFFSLFHIFFIHSFASAFLSLSVFVLLCLSCFTGFLSLMFFLGTNLKWIFFLLICYFTA